MTDKDFIERAKKAIQDKQSKIEEQTKKESREKQLTTAEGPIKWEALKQSLQQTIREINPGLSETLKYEGENASQFHMKNPSNHTSIVVSFAEPSAVITYGGSVQGKFHPNATGNELVYRWEHVMPLKNQALIGTIDGNALTADEMAKILIASLI